MITTKKDLDLYNSPRSYDTKHFIAQTRVNAKGLGISTTNLIGGICKNEFHFRCKGEPRKG